MDLARSPSAADRGAASSGVHATDVTRQAAASMRFSAPKSDPPARSPNSSFEMWLSRRVSKGGKADVNARQVAV
jgi:hypothetical protein